MSNKTTVGIACNITTGKLDSNHAVDKGKYPFFTCSAEPVSINTYAFNDNVVLIAGNNAQGNFHVNRFNGKFNAYQRTYILTAKDGFDIDYIYYSLKLELKRLKEKSQGSQTKFLTMPILTNIILNNLSIIIQKSISSVLSSLDAKIELNHKINRELEAVAKTLYDYWFVQFDFPDKNGKPYKSSGGKMVWNEQLKREIPEGWSSSNILSIADLKGGGTPSKKKSDYWEGSIPFFTPTDASTSVFILNTNDKITEIGLENCSSTLFNPGTIFITARGSVGKLMITTKAMAMNQSCYALCPQEDISPYYLYFLTKELIHHLQIKASGSVFDSIVTNDIIFTNLVIPIKEMIIFFTKLINPIFMQILNNQQENIILGELRDWLLPMLMNGQVTVQEAEERINMIAEPEVRYGK